SDQGYGFIQPQGGGKDVFVHISAVERAGLRKSQRGAGDRVRTRLEQGKTSTENRPSIAIFCGEHYRHSIGTRWRKAQLPTRKAYRLGRSWGWQVVWKPTPYFRKVRNISNRFAAENAAAMPY